MAKIAAMAITATTFKIFFSRTRRPMALKLGMKHQAMELYKVCINPDPGMTLTILRQGQLQRSSSLKPLGQSKSNFIESICMKGETM